MEPPKQMLLLRRSETLDYAPIHSQFPGNLDIELDHVKHNVKICTGCETCDRTYKQGYLGLGVLWL